MNISRCRQCGQPIPEWTRSNALFCTDFCRKKHYDIKVGRQQRRKQNDESTSVVK